MIKLLVNVVVVTLSQLAAPSPRRCPPWARTGALLNVDQQAAVARLEESVRLFLARDIAVSDRAFRTEALVSSAQMLSRAPIGLPFRLTSPSHAVLREGRAIFAKEHVTFDPCPYLGVYSAAAYIEPDLLKLDRINEAYRPSILPAPGGSQRGRAADLLDFFRQWDAHGRLHLEAPWTIARGIQGSLFAVPKTADVDRVVFNRVPQNAFEFHLPGYARYCVGGHDLIEIIIPPQAQADLVLGRLERRLPILRGVKAQGPLQRRRLGYFVVILRRDAGPQGLGLRLPPRGTPTSS